MRTLILSLSLALSLPLPALAGSSDALAELQAEEIPEIQETGITAFDSVFMRAKAIHETLDEVQDKIIGSQDKIAVAVGLEEGTPIRMTMWELKQRAGGPIEVQMRDNKPYLTLGGTGSDEVKAMIEATNQAAVELASIPSELAQLPAEVQQLVAACQAFPGQLNPTLLKEAGMNPLQLPKVAKTVASNIKAVTATPKRLENLGIAAKDLLTGIPQGLAATEPPEEAMQLARKSDDEDLDDLEDTGSSDEAVADLDEDLSDEEIESLDEPEEPVKAVRATKATRNASDEGSDEEYESPIAKLVNQAYAAFLDGETESAMDVIGQAEAALAYQTWPLGTADLLHLYQTAAVMHLSDNNASAATAAVAQALVLDPYAKPAQSLGPAYAKLHKSIAKSGVLHMVQLDLGGDGVGYLSGRRVEGGTRIEIPAGKHLLQVQKNGKWVSQIVWVNDGTTFDIP